MKFNVVFTEDVTKREDVDDKKERPQYRALGHSSGDGEGNGFLGFELYELCAIRNV